MEILIDKINEHVKSSQILDEQEVQVMDLPTTKTVNVYDPTNVDSVITTALITARSNLEEKMTCLSPTDYLLRDQFERYNWIGVYPTTLATKQFKGKEHHGLLKYEPLDKSEFKTLLITSRNGLDDLPHTGTLLEAYCQAQNILPGNWQMAMAISQIMECKTTSLEDQALVFANYQEARICIANKTAFEILSYNDGMMTAYQRHLKVLKAKISEIWNYTVINIEGKSTRVPVLNIGSELTPWAIKLISCSYDYVVTYEHVRNKTVYTVFSRVAGFQEVFEKCLDTKSANQIVFSGQL